MNNDHITPLELIIICGSVAVCAFLGGISYSTTCYHNAAIKAGVGRFESDPVTGEQRFVYGKEPIK